VIVAGGAVTWTSRWLAFAMTALALVSGSGKVTRAADHPTVRDGVYSPAQAAEGQKVYVAKCSTCHLESLGGGINESPALKGRPFISNFEGKPLRNLYSRILSTMPLNDPASLSDKEALAVVAYLLMQNGFPSSPDRSLANPDSLNNIEVVPIN
jgi:S-disulfanyl-L-cysteine oxidoreductase SoxD